MSTFIIELLAKRLFTAAIESKCSRFLPSQLELYDGYPEAPADRLCTSRKGLLRDADLWPCTLESCSEEVLVMARPASVPGGGVVLPRQSAPLNPYPRVRQPDEEGVNDIVPTALGGVSDPLSVEPVVVPGLDSVLQEVLDK